ncbi:TnsD family transposase [Lysinibacillus sp. NPDC056185]|uniref:TnsD family transposase n=1 Tax=Lysinibacillus sp. NPDC056185 TaxID=3345739 RepID=UPI0039F11BE0
MIAFFPSLYKDELLYSALARYHKCSGNLNNKESALDLFEKRKAYIISDLTTDLEILFNKVKHFSISSINDWIDHHTLYNYYTNFISKEIKQKVRDNMLHSGGNNSLHYSTGQMAGIVKEPVYFRYCPNCLEEDIQMYGETYWRTYHQLPSVFICLKHSVLLEDSSILVRQGNSSFFYPNIENCLTNKNKCDTSKIDLELLQMFAIESYKLTNKNYEFDQLNLIEIYHFLLQREGYVKTNGTIDQRRLEEDFIKKFNINFLKLMQSKPSGVDGNCWLRAITRKHRKSFHPIRHLLFIHFLGESVDTINKYANKFYRPFGEGPYLCLNPAANHYLKPVITNLKVTRCSDTKRPVGTFTCTCGFVYSRRGPDKTPEDTMKMGRIRRFGDEWLNKLDLLIENDKLSYRACSRILKVDTNTIIKYSRQRKSKPINKENNIKCVPKQLWLDLIKQYPTLSKTELRKMNPSLYMRIYRNDKEWLKKNPPSAKANVVINKRVDWLKRDLQILDEVKKVVGDLSSREKPVRITVSSIGKNINQKALLEKKLNKLPNMKEYIENVKENITDFQKRRITWSIKQLKNEEIEVWKIMLKAGIKKRFYPELELEINKQIKNSKHPIRYKLYQEELRIIRH